MLNNYHTPNFYEQADFCMTAFLSGLICCCC